MVRLSHIGHSTHLISRPTYPIRSPARSTIHRCSSVVVQVSTEGGCRGAFPLAALGIRRGMDTHPPRWGLGQRPIPTAKEMLWVRGDTLLRRQSKASLS